MNMHQTAMPDDHFRNLAGDRAEIMDEPALATSSLLSFFSHDIRNLASIISLNAERLLQSEREEDIVIGERIINQVDQVTNICRAAGGPRRAYQHIPFATARDASETILSHIVRDVVECLGGAKVPVAFKVYCDPAVVISCCRVMMFRTLYNLVSNAVQALDGMQDPEIVIGVVSHADFLKIDVIDNGPGLPLPIRRQFQNSDLKQPRTGGLGLLIAKSLTEEMGGTLDLVSSSSGGSHFRMTF